MTTQISRVDQIDGQPPIVHISDIHGYLKEARSALEAVGETMRFDPIVVTDEAGRLHWADNDYILVVNGDVIDRGPANEACLELVWRLQQEAPAGRVRYHLGNHELAIMLPTFVWWPDAYSTSRSADERQAFLERIRDGDVTAAFAGYRYTYSHAGQNEPFTAAEVNADLQAAAGELHAADGKSDEIQHHVEEAYHRVAGLGTHGARGAEAGLCWMDFVHLEPSAPPQIVGHSRRDEPVKNGNVVCGNVLRANQGSPGGEGVLVETPADLVAVIRQSNGGVSVTQLD